MKFTASALSTILLATVTTVENASAFSPAVIPVRHRNCRAVVETALSAQSSRRDAVGSIVTGAAGLASSLVVGTYHVEAANAKDVDYSQIQDLLKGQDYQGQQVYKQESARPTYLTEPTEEFKQNEEKASAFKRQQIAYKKEFASVLGKIDTDPNDETLLEGDLIKMTDLVHYNKGLPLGITKDDVIKSVRRRKGRKPRFWSTKIEIAYQDLIAEIGIQQSPNTKDEDNPF